MHDPTEGGLSTGLLEVAGAAGVGVIIDEEKIPVLPECRAICDRLGLEPLGLLASGALIITLPHLRTERLLEVLDGIGIEAAVIGSVVEAKKGVKMLTRSGIKDLPVFARDELARFLESG
jgi:hydrogenase maturation factor